MKLDLVYNAGDWKKWWSMRFIILSAFFQSITLAYATLPYDWMPVIPNYVKLGFAAGALGCAGLAGVSRVIQQSTPLSPGGKAVQAGVNLVEDIGRKSDG